MSDCGHELSPPGGVKDTLNPNTNHHSQRTDNNEDLWSISQTDILVNDAVPYIDPDDADSNACIFLDRRRGDIVLQSKNDATYVRDYPGELDKMSPEDRLALKRNGLDRPWVSYKCSGCRGKDIAESSFACQETDIAALIDREACEPEASDGADTLRDLIDYLLSQHNMRLMVDCLAFVLNLGACDDKAMNAIAKRHRIRKETFSRYCKKASQEFNLQSPQSTHGEKVHESCKPPQLQKDSETTGPANRDTATVLRQMIAYLLRHSNVHLTLVCLGIVFNLGVYTGESMTEIARRHKKTRQAVSKFCREIAKYFNVPPSRAMRSEAFRDSCRSAQLKRNRRTE